MGTPLHCYTGAGGAEYLESGGVGESKWCCGVMVEATKLQTASHIHII